MLYGGILKGTGVTYCSGSNSVFGLYSGIYQVDCVYSPGGEGEGGAGGMGGRGEGREGVGLGRCAFGLRTAVPGITTAVPQVPAVSHIHVYI